MAQNLKHTHTHTHTHMIQMNLLTKKKQIHNLEKELIVADGKDVGRG